MTFDYFGIPPTINKLMAYRKTQMQRQANGDLRSEAVPEDDKKMFKHFASFMVHSQQYLIPLDCPSFKKAIISEDLLQDVIHGRQRAVLNFDFSALEEQEDKLKDNLERL